MRQETSLEDLLERHEAEYKRKHPRAGTTPKFWQIENAPVWVEIKKVRYAAIVLEYAHLGDFNGDWCKLQLEALLHMLDGTTQKRTWEHPKPVQSYKLRKRTV